MSAAKDFFWIPSLFDGAQFLVLLFTPESKSGKMFLVQKK
jgi:hypothetical protein